MKSKLSLKFICATVIATIIITGGASLVYMLIAPEMYVNQQKSDILSAYNSIKQSNQVKGKKFKNIISSYEDDNFKFIITDSKYNRIYSSFKLTFTKRTILELTNVFSNLGDTYILNDLERDDSGATKLEFYSTLNVNSEKYYIYITENLGAINKNFNYTNKILIFIIAISILVETIVIAILTRKISVPITKLYDVANRVINNDYSARYKDKYSNDEVGNLARAFDTMTEKIQDNITTLNNYNFLLKEDVRMISEYDEMRKNVVRNITHDLKTPLAIISSQIEMMGVTNDPEKKKYYFNSAMEEISKMSNEISEILKDSKDNGYNPLFESINISSEIHKLSKDFKEFAESKNAVFKTNICKNITVFTNSLHLRYIFNNYVHNALKHVSQGGTIIVSFKEYDDRVDFEVYNDGSNIPENDLDIIWNNFERGEQKNGDIEGNGIGLYIVHEIALMSGDKCTVNNKKDGVSFIYSFIK